MKKVYLRFYDKKNLGDDLFVKIITSRYLNRFTFITPFVDSPFKKISNIELHSNRLIYNLSRVLRKTIFKKDMWLSYLLRYQDYLVYIGGSLFIEGDDITRWEQERNFYQNCRIPYYILGSNYGPQNTSEFRGIVEDIFRGANDVCFRDTASYDLFKGLGTTRIATDIAFTLDTSKYEGIKSEKIAIFSIVNCGNRFDETISNKYDQEVANMTCQLASNGYKIVYMSFCKYEGDEIANQRIINSLDSNAAKHVSQFRYDGNLDEALALIAKSEIMIATRFHAVILGLLFSKKVLPIAYSKKTVNILNDLNFKGTVVDINDIDTFNGAEFDFDNLGKNNIDEQIQIANLAFQELDKVLIRKE